MKKENLKTVFTILRFVLGVGLIVVLLIRLDFDTILQTISSIRIQYLGYALVLYLFFIFISAWRWQVLLDFREFNIPFRKTVLIYFIALFFNNFLPTTVGGDVMRVMYTMKERKADSLATVLVDRVLGFVGLFVFALFAVLYLLLVKHQAEFFPLIVIGLAVIIVITYVLFSERVYSLLAPLVQKIKILRLGQRLNHLHEAALEFGGAWRVIGECVVYSVIIQGVLSLAPFFVIQGMVRSGPTVVPFFVYVPIINVVSMIPISFNALGVREYFYVLLFSRAGVAGETSLSVSLVSFFSVFVLSLIGGVFFTLCKKQ